MKAKFTPNSQRPVSFKPASVRDRLTTVTPFSKYLAMTLFIILPFGSFWLGMQYEAGNHEAQADTTQAAPTDSTATSTPMTSM